LWPCDAAARLEKAGTTDKDNNRRHIAGGFFCASAFDGRRCCCRHATALCGRLEANLAETMIV
jgi:hypothetical protein